MRLVARYARFFAGRIGIAGMSGLALLVVTAGFFVASVQPLAEEVRTLGDRAERLQTRRAAAGAGAQASDPAAQVEALLNNLPALDKAPELVAQLHARAREHNLVLEAGEYHVVNDKDARLIRYQVRLPLKGGYVQIRNFVAAAMDGIPSMILEEFVVRRGSVSAREVDARIQFVLLFAEDR